MRKSKKLIVSLSTKEAQTIISMIDSEQSDGAKWKINGVWLDDIKTKILRGI